jgi:bacterioferritin-associated ferredoxin
MVVCHCEVVNDAALRDHIAAGSATIEEVAARCRAGTRCGGCRPTIERLLLEAVPVSLHAG